MQAPLPLWLLQGVNLEGKTLQAVFGELWGYRYRRVECHVPQTEWKEIGSCNGCSFSGQRMASNVIQILGNLKKTLEHLFPWRRAEGILFAHARFLASLYPGRPMF